MDAAHDLGGAEGFGRVLVEPDEPVWHADWEKAVFAMFPFGFAAGWWNTDTGRHAIERMPARDYLTTSYYGHWLHAFTERAVSVGGVDPVELQMRANRYHENPDEPLPADRNQELVGFVGAVAAHGASARREIDAQPRFAIGERVRVQDDSPRGHTRRARYIRGRPGEVVAVHGGFVYPDSVGNEGPEDPQHAYTVRFRGADLWGEGNGDPNVTVCVDVFEPYLQRAEQQP
jgi:nitrile hydratase